MKAKKGYAEGSKETQFKKGYTPWNYEGKGRLKRKFKIFNGKNILNSHYVFCKANNMQEIPKGFVVHHIDGDSLNDNIKNLKLMKDSEHKSLHNKISRGDDLSK